MSDDAWGARVPLALDRVLLKLVLAKVPLAILVPTLDVREDEVVPRTLLEPVYSAWWTRAAAPTLYGSATTTTTTSAGDRNPSLCIPSVTEELC